MGYWDNRKAPNIQKLDSSINGGAAWVAVYRALPPYEQAKVMAKAWAGAQRYHARRRGEPEPVISTFDATRDEHGVNIIPGTMREFDL